MPSYDLTSQWLAEYKTPLDLAKAQREPILREKFTTGWLAWPDSTNAYLVPPSSSAIHPWEIDNEGALTALRELTTQASYWKDVAKHYASENHAEVIVQDHASCVKSICMLIISRGED
ncbi:hypothetical protein PHLCEN_2v10978 [Hermanssonia centrifuga]|uniref:Uncharacterized protein n=1 Tax=Hermanssonia centrifuga TaxID=98765 RepID=A0A2R6NLG4_9APHY|nr:hypothetical protein PHLCEN_2v10978 [Hermanssonia centrifuga]